MTVPYNLNVGIILCNYISYRFLSNKELNNNNNYNLFCSRYVYTRTCCVSSLQRMQCLINYHENRFERRVYTRPPEWSIKPCTNNDTSLPLNLPF